MARKGGRRGPDGSRALDDSAVADRLAQFDIEIEGLRALCRNVVEGHDEGTVGPADPSIRVPPPTAGGAVPLNAAAVQ